MHQYQNLYTLIDEVQKSDPTPVVISAYRSRGTYNGYDYDNVKFAILDRFGESPSVTFLKMKYRNDEYRNLIGCRVAMSFDRFGNLLDIESVEMEE